MQLDETVARSVGHQAERLRDAGRAGRHLGIPLRASSIRYPSFRSPWRAISDVPTADADEDRWDRPTATYRSRAVARSTIMTISFWLDGRRPDPRPALRGALRADVAIVGAGFTGLWTAIRLAETDPTLRIVVVEAGLRRVRGERSERWLLRGEPRPRTGQRRAPLPRRDRPARTARPGEPPGAAGLHADPRDRLRSRGDRRARPSPTSRTVSRSCGPGSTSRTRAARSSSSSIATRSRPRSTRPAGWPAPLPGRTTR